MATSDQKRKAATPSARPVRADAQRNLGALLEAAAAVFARSGADAPAREIAEEAGVGVGTLYRHFPQRSDLVTAVFRSEVDACAEAAAEYAATLAPREALDRWIQRYVDLLATKRGLAVALHSGNPAYRSFPDYFLKQLRPPLKRLLDAAAAAGAARADVDAGELLLAIARLCAPVDAAGISPQSRRMVALLMDGLRVGQSPAAASPGKARDRKNARSA